MSEEVAHLGWRSAAKVQPQNRFRVLLIKNDTTDFFLLPPTLITTLPQPSVPHHSRIIIPSILMNEGGHSWLKQLWTQAGCTSHYHTNHDSKHSIIRTAHYYTALHWPIKTGNITREEEGAPDQEKNVPMDACQIGFLSTSMAHLLHGNETRFHWWNIVFALRLSSQTEFPCASVRPHRQIWGTVLRRVIWKNRTWMQRRLPEVMSSDIFSKVHFWAEIMKQLTMQGKSWKAEAEGIPIVLKQFELSNNS